MAENQDSLMKDFEYIEEQTQLLITDLASIDQSINEFRQKAHDAARSIMHNGVGVINKTGFGKTGTIIGGVLTAVSAGAALYGTVAAQKREEEAQRKYNQKMDIILSEKKVIAGEKMPVAEALRDKMSAVHTVVLDRFHEAFNENIDRTTLHTQLFERALCMYAKSKYTLNVLDFAIAEMKAWENGSHDSGNTPPDIAHTLDNFISNWGNDKNSIDEIFETYFNSTSSGEIHAPAALMLSNPCLFRNFIGIHIGQSNTGERSLIQLDENGCLSATNAIILNNNYVKDIMATDWPKAPKKPARIKLGDILFYSIIPICAGLISYGILNWESSWWWRIFWMLPLFCWVSFLINYIEDHEFKLRPFIKRVSKYNQEVDEYEKKVAEMELNIYSKYIKIKP